MDKADAINLLFTKYGSVEAVSKKVSIEPTTINRYLRVAKLPETVKQSAREGHLTSYHVLSDLVRLESPEKIEKVAQAIVGIPRETAREIIRYIFRNPSLDIIDSVKYVIQSYGEKYKLNVYFLSKTERTTVYDLNPIQINYFSDKIHITEHDDYIIAIIKKNDVSKIRSDGYDLFKFIWSVAK